MPEKRIALLTSAWTSGSRVLGLADRFLVGYPWAGTWHRPDVRIVAAYARDKPDKELAAERAKEFGFTLFPSVAEALHIGGAKLAVDGVLLLTLDADGAREELVKACVAVFDQAGRGVPVFVGGPLGQTFEQAAFVVKAARRLKFPLLCGSPLPLAVRLPAVDVPLAAAVEEALVVSPGGWDGQGYHALEAALCMVERRRGGETGIKSVQSLGGDGVWRAGEDARWSKLLLRAALSRSDSPQGTTIADGRTQDLVSNGEVAKLAANARACLVEHTDGTRTSVMLLEGAIKDFTFAARVKGGVIATQFFVAPPPNSTETVGLCRKVEDLFVSGKAAYPVERTLLATGIIEAARKSWVSGFARVETPHLAIRYQPPRDSQFCRE